MVLLFNEVNSVFYLFSIIFVICIIVIGFSWARLLNFNIAVYISKLDKTIEKAIHDQNPIISYEENAFSSLEHKLLRYITSVKSNEYKIQTEKNMINTLISDISHQTKTPLSNVILYSQLIEEMPVISDELEQYVQNIKSQSKKLDWLIRSLIKCSRLETGMISLQTKNNPILQTINTALAQVYAQAETKHIDIKVDCETYITVHHDDKWTSEAFFNVLENAVKYTEPDGNIQIDVVSNEMFTRVDISDNGIGITRGDLPHIFKRFYRGQQAREAEGVGIGLFLAHEIITEQGGYIKVTSEINKGTTFSFFLPQI